MKTINYEIDQTHPKGWLQRVMAPAQAACSWIIGRTKVLDDREGQPVDEPNDDGMLAWSISCRLAAVPEVYLNLVPPEVAVLIRESKDLHPQMASGSSLRRM